jgi:hypothetical protein
MIRWRRIGWWIFWRLKSRADRYGMISDLFSFNHYLLSTVTYRTAMRQRFVELREVAGVSADT